MKKRNIFLGIVCFLMMFILTGCGSKTVLTTNDFKSITEKNGYTTIDSNDLYDIKEATIAQSPDGFQIEFYVLDNEDNAISMFNANKQTFEAAKGDTSSYSEATIGNYSTYTLNTNGTYKHLCRVENTLLYVDVNDTYKTQAKKIIDELGY